MGWQLSNTVEMTNRIPEQYPFRYGSSYMYSLTTIIPNLGFWDLHPAAVHSNLSDWLQGIMNYHSGPGFSPVAEAFGKFRMVWRILYDIRRSYFRTFSFCF